MGGQPVPQVIFDEGMVENMRSASTEPGTITKASSASTPHSDMFIVAVGVTISRRQNMVVNPGMEGSSRHHFLPAPPGTA